MQRSLRNAEASVFGLTLRFLSVDSVTSVVKQIVQLVVTARRADSLPLAFSLVRAVVVRAVAAFFALSWAVAGDVAAVVAFVLEVQVCAADNFALLAASQCEVVGLVDAANR